jgi:hypothetical protein
VPTQGSSSAQPTKPVKPDTLQRILRLKPGPLRRLVIVVIVLAIVIGLGSLVSRVWTNYLWYAEVGQTTVFWTPLLARLCVGLFFAVIFFVIFYGNLWLARKISPRLLAVQTEGDEDVLELKPSRRWPGRSAAGSDCGRHHNRRYLQQPVGRSTALPQPR